MKKSVFILLSIIALAANRLDAADAPVPTDRKVLTVRNTTEERIHLTTWSNFNHQLNLARPKGVTRIPTFDLGASISHWEDNFWQELEKRMLTIEPGESCSVRSNTPLVFFIPGVQEPFFLEMSQHQTALEVLLCSYHQSCKHHLRDQSNEGTTFTASLDAIDSKGVEILGKFEDDQLNMGLALYDLTRTERAASVTLFGSYTPLEMKIRSASCSRMDEIQEDGVLPEASPSETPPVSPSKNRFRPIRPRPTRTIGIQRRNLLKRAVQRRKTVSESAIDELETTTNINDIEEN